MADAHGSSRASKNTKTNSKRPSKKTARPKTKKPTTIGASIIEGLHQAIAWVRGENDDVRVTVVQKSERSARRKTQPK